MSHNQIFSLSAQTSIAMIHRVARSLDVDMLEHVAFLGGATLALLLTDPAIAEVRATKDVDLIIEVLTYGHYTSLGDRLRQKGFHEDTSPGAPICRWQVDGIIVDIMPTDADILGFSNRWYAGALQTARPYLLPLGPTEPTETADAGVNRAAVNFTLPTIRLVTSFYFLATKLEAFANRGGSDIYASHDLEDIVTLVDGRPSLGEEIRSEAPDSVRAFIATTFRQLLDRPGFEEAVEGHLLPEARERLPLVLRLMEKIAELRE